MNTKAIVVPVEGDPRIVSKGENERWLDLFYREIDCSMVDCVDITEGFDAWVDDEGMLDENVGINQGATYIIDALRNAHYQPYFGTVVFTGGVDEDGETLGLDDEDAEMLVAMAHYGRGL